MRRAPGKNEPGKALARAEGSGRMEPQKKQESPMSLLTIRPAGDPTLARLPLYLRILKEMNRQGCEYASGAVVAKQLNLDPIVVRKDLAVTGVIGKPRLGFPVQSLLMGIEEFLGWSNTMDAVLVGAGSLGTALLGYDGFKQYGLSIVAVFDNNPRKVGKRSKGQLILPMSELGNVIRKLSVKLGILTVPAEHAQSVADEMVEGGVRGIWNFTPVRLKVPDDVILKREDLAASLAILSHRLYQMAKKSK